MNRALKTADERRMCLARQVRKTSLPGELLALKRFERGYAYAKVEDPVLVYGQFVPEPDG